MNNDFYAVVRKRKAKNNNKKMLLVKYLYYRIFVTIEIYIPFLTCKITLNLTHIYSKSRSGYYRYELCSEQVLFKNISTHIYYIKYYYLPRILCISKIVIVHINILCLTCETPFNFNQTNWKSRSGDYRYNELCSQYLLKNLSLSVVKPGNTYIYRLQFQYLSCVQFW